MPASEEHDIYCDVCEAYSTVSEDDDQCPGCGNCTCPDCATERERVREIEAEIQDDEEEERYDDDDDSPYDDGERETLSFERARSISARPNVSGLYLPNLPNREVRPMSFEQEIGRGAERVACELYDRGFAPDNYVHSYGSSRAVNRSHEGRGTFVHVETDSSCGGEVIYSRLQLSDEKVAREFGEAFAIVRNLHADDDVVLNMRCGFHIHVGIQGFGMRAIENLYHAHNYLEDVLFRLGSANWRVHRSEASNTYAPVVEKGLLGKSSIGHFLERSRSALNLSNYLASRSNCQCGAFAFADWEACQCDLPKATVEFRWPNATTNEKKVHAFSSLLQAIVAAADHADDGAFDRLPALSFAGSTRVPDLDSWLARVDWIGANLELTANELDSLAYCFTHAHFGEHSDYLASCVRRLTPVRSELVSL